MWLEEEESDLLLEVSGRLQHVHICIERERERERERVRVAIVCVLDWPLNIISTQFKHYVYTHHTHTHNRRILEGHMSHTTHREINNTLHTHPISYHVRSTHITHCLSLVRRHSPSLRLWLTTATHVNTPSQKLALYRPIYVIKHLGQGELIDVQDTTLGHHL